jgi:hypothetical protein
MAKYIVRYTLDGKECQEEFGIEQFATNFAYDVSQRHNICVNVSKVVEELVVAILPPNTQDGSRFVWNKERHI